MGKSTLQLNTYLGPYYLVKLIAIGGMAEIYLCTTKGVGGFEKQLALKVIAPDYADDRRFVQMLVDEAKIAVKLNHPNIAQTFDLGKLGNVYFISMEYVRGADYFQVLKRTSEAGREFPVPAALLVAHEALRGLDYAHKKCDDDGTPLAIIHRDISPQNILLSHQGEVKLVDFGIAKAANLSPKTRSGTIKGKLVYMSPEQSWGDKVDQRTDIFSMGIVLYEALTGGSLYLEKNPVKLLEMVRKAEIPLPSTRRGPVIPPELDRLVMTSLDPDPDGRYPTASDFADAVADLLGRRYADFSARDLGQLVSAVMARDPEPPPAAKPLPPSLPSSLQDQAMRREDFAVPLNSIIFSAEDMMESHMRLPRVGGQPREPSQARLVLLEKGNESAWPLGEQFIMGRAGDLRLGDARVSRRHARICLQQGQHVLEDLGSSNGTFLNDQKLEAPCILKPGDIVRIGPFYMRFDLPEPGEGMVDRAQPEALDKPWTDETPPSGEGQEEVWETLSEDAAGQGGAYDELGRAASAAARGQDAADVAAYSRAAGAGVVMLLGDERLRLDIGDRLPLSHDAQLGEQTIPGAAAAMVRRADGYWLEPMPGRERVALNGQPLPGPTRLGHGDRVLVGPVELEFVES